MTLTRCLDTACSLTPMLPVFEDLCAELAVDGIIVLLLDRIVDDGFPLSQVGQLAKELVDVAERVHLAKRSFAVIF